MNGPADPDYAGVRAMVTGARGFFGQWMVRHLQVAGATVIPLVRPSSAPPAGGEIAADLEQPGVALQLVEQHRPEVVFNLAGYGVDAGERDPAPAWHLNDRLVGELAAAMSRCGDPTWPGAALVHTGSALEYGPVNGPVTESLRERPTTLYGRSKLAGTRRLQRCSRRTGLRAVVARVFTAYGPGEHDTRLLPSLVQACGSGAAVPLTEGKQERDFVYVEDVVEALLWLGRQSSPGAQVVNVATGILTTVRRFAEITAEHLAVPASRLQFGALPYRAEEMWHGPVAVDRLRELTGFQTRHDVWHGVRQALKEMR